MAVHINQVFYGRYNALSTNYKIYKNLDVFLWSFILRLQACRILIARFFNGLWRHLYRLWSQLYFIPLYATYSPVSFYIKWLFLCLPFVAKKIQKVVIHQKRYKIRHTKRCVRKGTWRFPPSAKQKLLISPEQWYGK